MSKVIVEQRNKELIFIIEGEPRTYSMSFSSKDEATKLKPDIREIIWAVERSHENSREKGKP